MGAGPGAPEEEGWNRSGHGSGRDLAPRIVVCLERLFRQGCGVLSQLAVPSSRVHLAGDLRLVAGLDPPPRELRAGGREAHSVVCLRAPGPGLRA